MKIVFLLLIVAGAIACGVKGDPVPPTPADVVAPRPSPSPEPKSGNTMLRKHGYPEYDQQNDDEE